MAKPDIRARLIGPSFDPQKLSHFLAVYNTGSFTAAALENGVSQQAISKAVARLEDALGVSLFERTGFGARPTIFAETLARRAKAIIAEGRLATAELSALRGSGQGYVRIGLGWTFLSRVGPQFIEEFKRRRPQVTVSVVTGDSRSLYAALLSGEVEVVASAPPRDVPVDKTIHREALFVESDVLTMRKDHPLAARENIALEELSRQQWAVAMSLQYQWRQICQAFLDAGIEPPSDLIDLDSVLLVKAILLQSDAIALLSRELFANGVEGEHYAMLDDPRFAFNRVAYVAWRDGVDLQPLARELRDTMVRTVGRFVKSPADDIGVQQNI